jgi:hypothetical protein
VQDEMATGALEHARWELAATTGRLRALEDELRTLRGKYQLTANQRDQERARNRTLRGSESYRIGKAVVSFVKNPVGTSPRLIRGAIRRLRRSTGPKSRVTRPAGERRGVAATGPKRLPVHLYVAIGLTPDALRAFVRTVSRRVQVNADHLPVVVTDSPTFSLLRNLGVVLEYVPDRVTWERHRPDRNWDDVLSERLSRLFRDHESVRTLVVDRRNLPDLAQLLALDAC